MTVSELLDRLKDCAPNADVYWFDDKTFFGVMTAQSDGEKVILR